MLSALEVRRTELKRSLNVLIQYQREMTRLTVYSTAFALHNRSVMHHQLGKLIEEQHSERVALKLTIEQQKQELLRAYVAKKSTEIMLERIKARHSLEMQRHEQKELDELARNQMHLARHYDE